MKVSRGGAVKGEGLVVPHCLEELPEEPQELGDSTLFSSSQKERLGEVQWGEKSDMMQGN